MKSASIPGFEIAYQEWGPLDAPPVLALHGWLDNSASFEALAEVCPDLHLVAVDSPGCGHSSHYPEGAFPNLLDELFHLFRFADVMGWEKLRILGHSRGAVLACYMAAAAPERVQRIGLIEALGPLVDTLHGNVERLQRSLDSVLRYRPYIGTVYPDLDAAARSRMARGEMSMEGARRLAAWGTDEVEGGVQWRFDRSLLMFLSPIYPTEEQVLAVLRSLRCPVLGVMADGGYPFNAEVIEARISAVEDLQLLRVQGGHHVHLDDPDCLAHAVNEFFAE